MVVKVYISGISGNKEVKKHQQRVLMILESKSIECVVVDITEPGKESEKEFMQQNSKTRTSKYPLPPQLFNEDVYCGDYEDFDLANEVDDLEVFLKMSANVSKAEITLDKADQKPATTDTAPVENGDVNGTTSSRENSAEKESTQKTTEQPEEPTESKTAEEETQEE